MRELRGHCAMDDGIRERGPLAMASDHAGGQADPSHCGTHQIARGCRDIQRRRFADAVCPDGCDGPGAERDVGLDDGLQLRMHDKPRASFARVSRPGGCGLDRLVAIDAAPRGDGPGGRPDTILLAHVAQRHPLNATSHDLLEQRAMRQHAPLRERAHELDALQEHPGTLVRLIECPAGARPNGATSAARDANGLAAEHAHTVRDPRVAAVNAGYAAGRRGVTFG